jgi:hypothetical protein
MPAWIAGIQTPQDGSRDIHVNLGSGHLCRNDGADKITAKVDSNYTQRFHFFVAHS